MYNFYGKSYKTRDEGVEAAENYMDENFDRLLAEVCIGDEGFPYESIDEFKSMDPWTYSTWCVEYFDLLCEEDIEEVNT